MRTLTKDAVNKIGEQVTLMGWVQTRRDHGKLIFIDLRDRWGMVQVVFSSSGSSPLAGEDKSGGQALFAKEGRGELLKEADRLRPEWVVKITGIVKERPGGMENPELPTGKVEIEATGLEILAESKTPPFSLDTDGYEIGEEHRMEYRYLDLRRERMRKNLILRDRIISFIRQYLHARDFIEVETPILTKSTPEGARDYVVPARLYPGKFFALPQSPQQYKQLLMVAGLERYFQIARCFRDEDTRGDRQPEFTQLDIEMSFASQAEILALVEELFIKLAEEAAGKKVFQKPFPRLTHKEATDRFGADKFDLRPSPDPELMAFAWVVDFPLFEKTETQTITSSHHPFSAPRTEDIPWLDSDPLQVRAWQHDLVLNGYEIGGGSVRITDPELQKKIFTILGYSEKEVEEKFGHLLKAFSYGVPPHGGIALGIDRLVAVLQNEPSIREVIAFPKTGDARDLMMEAPSELDEKQLKELHLKVSRL